MFDYETSVLRGKGENQVRDANVVGAAVLLYGNRVVQRVWLLSVENWQEWSIAPASVEILLNELVRNFCR